MTSGNPSALAGELWHTWGKSILSTRQCQTMTVHGCLSTSSARHGRQKWKSIQRSVSKYMARVHHYREAVRSRDDASNHSQATQQCYRVASMNSKAAAAANEDNLIRPYVYEMKERLAELEKLVFRH